MTRRPLRLVSGLCPYGGCRNAGWVLTHDARRLCGVHARAEERWHRHAAELLRLQLGAKRGASQRAERRASR